MEIKASNKIIKASIGFEYNKAHEIFMAIRTKYRWNLYKKNKTHAYKSPIETG